MMDRVFLWYNTLMTPSVIEEKFPIDFRKKDVVTLGDHLKHRHSVDLVGMKRVGISNFLRFFLYHEDIPATYIQDGNKHLFIPVDLNDLVEREIFPFWTLTLKRIADTVESSSLPADEKKNIESLFLKTIQTQDHFLAIDSVRQATVRLISKNILPTIFFIRFDRIKDAVAPSFFDNLQGLRDATGYQLAYVFTSYRSLDELSPAVFPKTSAVSFSQTMYVKLAEKNDMETIYKTFNSQYKLPISKQLYQDLLSMVNGHVQYLLLSLIILHERKKQLPKDKDELFNILTEDERITLQSEELWESLTEQERTVLLQTVHNDSVSENDKEQAKYLWETGFIHTSGKRSEVFSPLFRAYLEHNVAEPVSQMSVHFSRKELALYHLLEQHMNEICEREEIIQAVWPEYSEMGISDWAIDRLVARVRVKLRQQESLYEIKTVRTRGYELVRK